MYSSNCSGCYSGTGQQYSSNNITYQSSAMYSLESRVSSVATPSPVSLARFADYSPRAQYPTSNTYTASYSSPLTHTLQTYHSVDAFLNPQRSDVQFIDNAQQIEHYVRDAFFLTTGKELPSTMVIHVVPRDELKHIHELNGGAWSDGILGFSMNSNGTGNDLIFVRENDLDRLMLVMGHEIGHVTTKTLRIAVDEEAKAFAFEMAWMKNIVKHNLANLRDNIRLDFQPAQNGLHNVAFSFVKNLLQRGKEALQIYFELVQGLVSVVA